MANPFGEIAGKIGAEVAEGLAKKAAPVVAKTAKKAVKAVEDKADDWGWKGGKPGEVTAGTTKYEYPELAKLGKQLRESQSTLGSAARKAAEKSPTDLGADWQIGARYRGALQQLEQADVPRKWTGKITAVARDVLEGSAGGANIASSLLGNKDPYAYKGFASALSSAMRPLTNSQRETLLTLLADEIKSPNKMKLAELVNMAKNL